MELLEDKILALDDMMSENAKSRDVVCPPHEILLSSYLSKCISPRAGILYHLPKHSLFLFI